MAVQAVRLSVAPSPVDASSGARIHFRPLSSRGQPCPVMTRISCDPENLRERITPHLVEVCHQTILLRSRKTLENVGDIGRSGRVENQENGSCCLCLSGATWSVSLCLHKPKLRLAHLGFINSVAVRTVGQDGVECTSNVASAQSPRQSLHRKAAPSSCRSHFETKLRTSPLLAFASAITPACPRGSGS